MTDRINIVVRESGTQRVTRSIDNLGDVSEQADGKVRSLQGTLIRFAGGAAVGAAFAAGVRNALQFNTAVAEVSTLVDAADFDIRRLTQGLREQSREFGLSNVEQAGAAYQIISAGAGSAAEALETLDAANTLAVAGVTDVETAADGLTSVLNAYGDAVESATAVSDALFVGVRAGKTTVDELAGSLGRVAPLAATAGVSFDELVASVAALTKGGISTREAVTGVRGVLASVVKPTQEAQEAAERLGIQFNAAALESQGLETFLNNLITATDGNTEELAQLFGGVEALVPILALTGAAGEDFTEILRDLEDAAGTTEEAFNKIANSPGFQIDRLVANINTSFEEFVGVILQAAVPAIRFLADNIDEVFRVLTVFGTFIGVTLASRLIPVAVNAIRGFATSTALAFATNPITAFAAAVTAAVGVFVAFSDRIRLSAESSATALDLINVVLGRIANFAGSTFSFLGNLLTGFQVDLGNLSLAELVVNFGRGLDIIFANFRATFAAIETFVINSVNRLGRIVSDTLNQAVGLAENFVTGLNVIGRRITFQEVDASVVADFGLRFQPRFSDAGRTSGEAFTQEFEAAIQDGAGQRFAAGLLSDAEARAATRDSAAAAAAANVPTIAPGGTGGTSGSGSDASAALARAEAIGEVVTALERESDALQRTGLDRDVFLAQLSAEDSLRNALSNESLGLTQAQIDGQSRLTAAERERLDALIRGNAIEAQRQQFDEARGALIGQTIRDLEAEANILRVQGEERDDLNQILQVEAQLRQQLRRSDLELSEDEINRLSRLNEEQRDRVTGLREEIRVLQAREEIVNQFRNPQEEVNRQLSAANQLFQEGAISSEQYGFVLRDVNEQQRQFRIQSGDGTFADGFLSSLERMSGGIRSFTAESGRIFGNFFDTIGKGFADTIGAAVFDIDNLGESLKAVARDAISQLISSLIQLGIQFVANQILGATLGSAATAFSATQAGILSSAWAPAAAAASLATAGANAAPAAAGIASTFALTNALSAVPGFQDGIDRIIGPGTSRSDSILARLSRDEGVVNARGNNMNPGVVAAMNRGERVGGTTINNFNFPPGTDVESFRKSRRQLDRDARTRQESA
jgi:TP901 family phage tail tape measure protein